MSVEDVVVSIVDAVGWHSEKLASVSGTIRRKKSRRNPKVHAFASLENSPKATPAAKKAPIARQEVEFKERRNASQIPKWTV